MKIHESVNDNRSFDGAVTNPVADDRVNKESVIFFRDRSHSNLIAQMIKKGNKTIAQIKTK